MTVLVTGGRGSIARGVVDGLVAAGVPVRLGGREPAELTPPGGVEVVEVDLSRPETLPSALAGVDKVLLYAEPSGVDAFVAAATEAGVEQVVVVSSGSVSAGGDDPIARRHRAVEEAVAAAGFASTMLRPHAFAGNARQWLPDILGSGVVRLPYPDADDVPIDERDIADVAVAVLLAGPGGGFDGAAPDLTGPAALSRRQEVELLAAALGRTVRVVPLVGAEARAFMSERMPDFVVDALLGYLQNAGDGAGADIHADSVEKITGHPARTFATWVAEVAAPLAAR